MTRPEREAEFDQMRIHPPVAKFEWEGDEEALAAMFDKQEKEMVSPDSTKGD
jgi:hypothetical protein